jgi:cytidylate kinase
MKKTFIIAIDGLAATGKSTLTKNLANHLNFQYLLTGNLYRALAKKVITQDISIDNVKKIVELAYNIGEKDIEDPDLNVEDIAKMGSIVASIKEVRLALLDVQRNYANKGFRGVVVEGRDIGTVIFPSADVKLFITASLESRAKRRYKELQNKGFEVIYEKILEDLASRDLRDATRVASPLKKADDAILIDTSDLDIEQVLEVVLKVVTTKYPDIKT